MTRAELSGVSAGNAVSLDGDELAAHSYATLRALLDLARRAGTCTMRMALRKTRASAVICAKASMNPVDDDHRPNEDRLATEG